MKQLTDTEKQQLETKIKAERERQKHLRETNPDLPETFKNTSAKTEFIPTPLWKYSFLAIILCLLAFNAFLFIKSLNSDIKNISILNLMIASEAISSFQQNRKGPEQMEFFIREMEAKHKKN